MLQSVNSPHPWEAASAQQLLKLADEYRTAAHTLQTQGKKGKPLSRAPFRLAAIHAIELYLNALLRHKGMDAALIRNMQHCLSRRAELAPANGLRLRKKTADHLMDMTVKQEYVATRYAPELIASGSEITRLKATLDEVAQKVSVIIATQD